MTDRAKELRALADRLEHEVPNSLVEGGATAAIEDVAKDLRALAAKESER